MAKTSSNAATEGTDAWNFHDIMRKVKMAAALEGKTAKEILMEVAESKIQDLERKGISRKQTNQHKRLIPQKSHCIQEGKGSLIETVLF